MSFCGLLKHICKRIFGFGSEFKPKKAICIMKGEDGVEGTVMFLQQNRKSPLEVKGEFNGLTQGKHGFHVHEFGDLSNGCTSAGAHFNPFNQTHGGPGLPRRHVGDFGNVEATSDGHAKFYLKDQLATLYGENSILGRSMVLHRDEDDLGTGKFPDSTTTGHAGARIACGVIAVADATKITPA
ncbi:hypothetical protein ACOME3_005100 [Neoechinorhynchus agilis]